MLVETFEVVECIGPDGERESDAEAVELIKALGLEGQKKLLTSGDVRIPYRKMTAEEKSVYETLLSTQTKLEDYSDGPIPVRVLQVASHALTFKGIIDRVEVWHPANADDKDPLLVGIQGDKYSPKARFLLARWGEELAPYPALKTKAAAKSVEPIRAALAEIIARAKARMEGLSPENCLGASTPVAYHL